MHGKLECRECEPEEIDDPELASDLLEGALQGLSRINSLSRSANILWAPIRNLARRLQSSHLRVLDIATGAGDLPIALWRKARKSGLRLEIQGIDINERVLAFARRKASDYGADIAFSKLDVLSESLPQDYDVVISSLFLHHLSDDAGELLFRRMANAARHLVLVNDLNRHPLGLILAHFAGMFITRSPVVRVDAVRSVRAAFTIAEARDLATRAGLSGVVVSSRWPCRFLLSWQREPPLLQ